MTKFVRVDLPTLYPVSFIVYSRYTQGPKKGKAIPGSFISMTLYRDADNGESVADTIRKLKEQLYGEYDHKSKKIMLNVDAMKRKGWELRSALESPNERHARRERDQLEVIEALPITIEATPIERMAA